MANPKKWSEQSLVKQMFETQENGEVVQKELNVLEVCTFGIELYKKEFKSKYDEENKNMLVVPFDFVIFAGDSCPRGRFYELEYTIGEYGKVFRGLFELVKPEVDIRTVLATMKRNNILPEDFTPRKLYLRDDIDAVSIGVCMKGENEEVDFHDRYIEAVTSDKSITESLNEYGICFEYYRGGCREILAKKEDIKAFDKVFVCGGANVFDDAFKEQREDDMARLEDLLEEASGIAHEYCLPHMFAIQYNDEEVAVSGHFDNEWFDTIVELLKSQMK